MGQDEDLSLGAHSSVVRETATAIIVGARQWKRPPASSDYGTACETQQYPMSSSSLLPTSLVASITLAPRGVITQVKQAAVSVIVGLIAASLGYAFVDTVASLAVAAVIAWTAWAIVRGVSGILTDAAVGDVERIADVARSVEGVKGCHQVRARGVAGMIRVDLHITVDPEMRVEEAHQVAEMVEKRVRERVGGIAEVLVHVGAVTLHK